MYFNILDGLDLQKYKDNYQFHTLTRLPRQGCAKFRTEFQITLEFQLNLNWGNIQDAELQFKFELRMECKMKLNLIRFHVLNYMKANSKIQNFSYIVKSGNNVSWKQLQRDNEEENSNSYVIMPYCSPLSWL